MRANSRGRSRGPALLLALFLLGPPLLADAGSGSPAHKTLANGLEVFVVENHAVPLATVCVAFRGGASAQDRSDAGLFHLYEHLLFASNEKYANQAAFTAALNSLGVPNWNGSTGGEDIEYHITIPSAKLDEGVEFWSWAVRHPVFDPAKLDTEKGVVLDEIRGYHADPDQIFENALDSRAFPTYPWRKNVDGPEANIQGATVARLKTMQAAWYVPSNAAILVGGDVKPEEVFASVEKWFGDWRGEAALPIGDPPQPGFGRNLGLLYVDSGFYKGIDNVRVQWRGPDVLRDTKDSYVADVLLFLTRSPVGHFKKDLADKVSDLYDPEYIDFGYPTARDGGVLYLNSYLRAGEGGPLVERAEALRQAVIDELALIAKDPRAYFGDEELALAKRKLVDENLLAMEDTASFVSGTLVFWWAVASSDYFFNYEANCSKVSFEDISAFLGKYVLGRNSEIGLRVSSRDAAKDKDLDAEAGARGYEKITAADAFWWQTGEEVAK